MKNWTAILGTTATALVAHIPCCGPSLLLALGGASTFAGIQRVLEPYRPLILALTFLQLGFAFWFAYRKPKCADACTQKHVAERRTRIGVTWGVAALVMAITLWPHQHNHDREQIVATPPTTPLASTATPMVQAASVKYVVNYDIIDCSSCARQIYVDLMKSGKVQEVSVEMKQNRAVLTLASAPASPAAFEQQMLMATQAAKALSVKPLQE